MTRDAAATLDASVVIPAFRRTELLRKAIESALAQDFEADRFEVIVVDSSPDEANARMVESLIESNPGNTLRFYRKAPEGPGPSRLLGARQARGEVIAYLDSDCQATPGWLAAGLAAFVEGMGIVQGRTMPEPGKPVGIFSRYVQIEAENPRYEACNIFFHRDCIDDVGEAKRDNTPNQDRPTGGEDALMAWRVKRKGWNSRFASDALVYHEILPISVWHWLFEKRMYMLPWLAREVPEMKGEFYLDHFLDFAHACLTLMLVCLLLALTLSPWWLLGCLPYAWVRALEPTRSMKGVKRILRVLIYLPRDLLAFALLLLGSLRYRTLLL